HPDLCAAGARAERRSRVRRPPRSRLRRVLRLRRLYVRVPLGHPLREGACLHAPLARGARDSGGGRRLWSARRVPRLHFGGASWRRPRNCLTLFCPHTLGGFWGATSQSAPSSSARHSWSSPTRQIRTGSRTAPTGSPTSTR